MHTWASTVAPRTLPRRSVLTCQARSTFSSGASSWCLQRASSITRAAWDAVTRPLESVCRSSEPARGFLAEAGAPQLRMRVPSFISTTTWYRVVTSSISPHGTFVVRKRFTIVTPDSVSRNAGRAKRTAAPQITKADAGSDASTTSHLPRRAASATRTTQIPTMATKATFDDVARRTTSSRAGVTPPNGRTRSCHPGLPQAAPVCTAPSGCRTPRRSLPLRRSCPSA